MNNIIVSDVRMNFNSFSLNEEISCSRETRVKKEEHARKENPKINTIRKGKVMFPSLDFLDGIKWSANLAIHKKKNFD